MRNNSEKVVVVALKMNIILERRAELEIRRRRRACTIIYTGSC